MNIEPPTASDLLANPDWVALYPDLLPSYLQMIAENEAAVRQSSLPAKRRSDMKPPKGYEECDSCNPCNPDCDETGRPYTCYRCCDTGFMLADQHYFEYLDELRDSGVTNMFGAGIYLETEFGVDRYEAKRILLAWMVSCEGVNHA